MAHLVWNTDLMTGINEIDVQHQRIVQYINDLDDARQTHDRNGIGKVIEETIDYTLSHFAFEEAMMEDAGYRFVGPHKKVHELFTRKASELQARFEGGEDVAGELHGMLSRWLFNHIRHDDGSYTSTVKAHLQIKADSPEEMKKQLKKELMEEMDQRRAKRGWLGRIFGD